MAQGVTEFIQQVVNGLVLGSVYTLMAVGLTLLYGILGVVNWAHGEIYMLGAFVGLYLVVRLNLPYFTALLLTMVVMAGLGLVVERAVFRPLRRGPGINVTIGTLGLSTFLLNSALQAFGPNPQRFPTAYTERYVALGPVAVTEQRLLVLLVSLVIIGTLSAFIKFTRLGKAMRACAQNPLAANLMGIDTHQVAALTSALGALLAGVAGTLIGPIFLVYPAMSIQAVSKAFAVVVLGGLGRVEGAIAAGFFLGLVESLAGGYISSYFKDLITFAILILALVFRPAGLFGHSLPEKV